MKLIAIRPLKNLKKTFLNNLKIGEYYYFSSEYRFDPNYELIRESKLPDHFFNTGKPDINVSAIVGKNGSGKSSVIELMLRIINNISHKFFKKIGNPKVEIKKIDGVYGELIFKTDRIYRVLCEGDSVVVYTERTVTGALLEEVELSHSNFEGLFYSIVTNYSHYAYNPMQRKDEEWLEKVFHKNDGYQTPLVLNPFRKHGNIDINTENHLVHARLMTNLIQLGSNSIYNDLLDQLEFDSFLLTLRKQDFRKKVIQYSVFEGEEKVIRLDDIEYSEDYLWARIAEKFNIEYEVPENYLELKKYLIYKAISIYFKYYINFNDTKVEDPLTNQKPINFLVDKIYKDKSHVVLKFKQAANLLRYKYIDVKQCSYKFSEYLSLIKKFRNKGNSYIEFLPPAIFNTKIFLENKNDSDKNKENRKDEIEFESLSSGQKQQLYSISSILYHISNIESVSRPRGNSNKIKYSYINIVLEEIELYSHPEMQRIFLNNLLNAISALHLKDVKSINIVIITHSPFILSDIPLENVMLLKENGLPEDKSNFSQTFGSNIHELFTNSFFLKNSLMGEFARRRIEQLIEELNIAKRISKEEFQNNYKKRIEIIGEPFIQSKLFELVASKSDDNVIDSIIDMRNKEIDRLRMLKERLGND
ncbi:AAA family ATPase [uncultured Algoriphagus sp.]|uniref:AAA family ATPase n=1 Tax=uncultured Algoriphagus sp. TaxID=417365 RepID=UPI0030EB9717|tara:strand:- start:720 stop:2654 length:1935 start_codon:yes stop_codon:yes gene_type:complete